MTNARQRERDSFSACCPEGFLLHWNGGRVELNAEARACQCGVMLIAVVGPVSSAEPEPAVGARF